MIVIYSGFFLWHAIRCKGDFYFLLFIIFASMIQKISHRIWIWIWILLVPAGFSGCKVYETFTIDVMEPAEIFLPENIHSVLLAHNAFRDTTKNAGTQFIIFGESLTDTVYRDSALANKALSALSEILEQTGKVKPVIKHPAALHFPDKSSQYTEGHINKIRALRSKGKCSSAGFAGILWSDFGKIHGGSIFRSHGTCGT